MQTGDDAVAAVLPLTDVGLGRTAAGCVLAVVLPAGLQGLLLVVWSPDLTTASLLQLTGAVVAALVGGILPGLLAALWASLLLNYFMVEPTGSLFIHDVTTVVSLACFMVVSGMVASVVHVSARRLAQARRAATDAAVLNRLALVVVAAEDPVRSLLSQAQEVFGLDGVALFVRSAASGTGQKEDLRWERWATAGLAPATLGEADSVQQVDEYTALVLRGGALSAGQRELLKAFSAQLVAVRDRQRLAVSMNENRVLAQDNQMRTSILQAVSHDLRTPLAGIKLAVSTLLQPHSQFDDADQRELLMTTEAYADQLGAMVENLLDMSRISSGAVAALMGPVHWQDVLPGALRAVPRESIDLAGVESSASVVADAGLLERVIANLAENAARHAPDSRITLVARESVEVGGTLFGQLRVIDTGSASLPEDLEELFVPFQRFGDAGGGHSGTGLGLAVARGLTEAMGGTLQARRTPGGGLTMVLCLRQAGSEPGTGSDVEDR